MSRRLPKDVLEFFRKAGSRGGKLGGSAGGKRSLVTMTDAERKARAQKAAAKGAEVRSKKAAAKQKAGSKHHRS